MAEIHQYSIHEEIANATSHGIGAILSIVALSLLVSSAALDTDMTRMVSFSIYGASLIILFTASTFYHAFINEKAKKLFKLLDHCAIYLLIAGTYTPLMLITLQGTLGYTLLVLVWTIAIAGIAFKVICGHKYKKISLISYVGMGFISLPILSELYKKLSPDGLLLLAGGGAIYLAGIFFYVAKKIPFNHAIWHLFVLAAATCHFYMMWYFV